MIIHERIHSENGHNMRARCDADLDAYRDPPNWVFKNEIEKVTCPLCIVALDKQNYRFIQRGALKHHERLYLDALLKGQKEVAEWLRRKYWEIFEHSEAPEDAYDESELG